MSTARLRRFFDWQLTKVLFEETWVFQSRNTQEDIERRVREYLSAAGRDATAARVAVKTDGDCLTVRSKYYRMFSATLNNNYYFCGRISPGPQGTTLRGRYRAHGLRRALSLIWLNIYLIAMLVPIGLLLYALLRDWRLLFDDHASMFGTPFVFAFLFGFMFVFLGMLGTDWLLTRIEKIGRRDIRDFLSRITDGTLNSELSSD